MEKVSRNGMKRAGVTGVMTTEGARELVVALE